MQRSRKDSPVGRWRTKALQVLMSKILGLSHLQVSGGCELMKGYMDSGKQKRWP